MCLWVNSGNWWWTGRPGVLRFMGLQRVRHNWAIELNSTEQRTRVQSRCPSTDEWIKKLWHMYTVKCYSALKINTFESVLMRCMNLELNIQSRVSQKEKNRCHVLMNIYRKTFISALLTMPKTLTVWITINCGKFWKRWEYQTTWPASWESYMQVRKQQLELDMEQQTHSKLEKEYVKAVYCHPAYLT